MPDLWLDLDKLLAVTGWSHRTVRRRMAEGELLSRSKVRRGRNGRVEREYSASSLPAELQLKIRSNSESDTVGDSQGSQFLFATPPTSTALQCPRIPVTAAHEQQIQQRMNVIDPLLRYLQLPKEKRREWRTNGKAVLNSERLVELLSEEHGVGRATIWRWYKTFKSGGEMFDRTRHDKGQSRWFTQHPKAADLAADLYLNHRQSFRACFEAILQDRELLEIAEDELPSYGTVRAWLNSAPAYLTAYARDGRRAYQNRMSPYIRRHYRDVSSNQIWVSDHMIHDVEVLNDCFPDTPYGTPMRLQFTCLLDYRSRYVVGASWCRYGSSGSIATAIRRAVTENGPCEHFYCDNGKDYLKVTKGAVPAYLADEDAIRGWHQAEIQGIEQRGIMARLGIKVTHCIVRHPQSKHVERFFRTLHEQFDKRWKTYTAGASHLRPDATAAAMDIHRKLMRHGRVHESHHPPASYFIRLCMFWIDEYHNRPHSGEGMDGRTPAQVFAGERGDTRRPVPEPHELAVMLAERASRKIRECSIELHNRRYTYHDATSRDVMHAMNECEVIVAFDPLDREYVVILDEDGHYLCDAKSEAFLEFSPADIKVQGQISESMADRRHLEKQTRAQLETIARKARINGARNPVEMLAERAKLPAIVGQALTHRAPRLKADPDAVAPPSAADIAAECLAMLKAASG